MNRPVRNRFLQLLRNLCAGAQDRSLESRLATSRGRNSYFRTPLLESLEGRRVMAANISQFTPTDSGFVVQFSEAVDTTKINLYTTSGGAMGAADVTVQGATTGAIKGTAVFSGTTMTFVTSGGVLAADTYTVTLRSATDGFTDLADGELLDGENNATLPSGNGTAGGNFVRTFVVGAGTSVSVGFADIARGPGQALQGPPSGSGATLPEGLAIQLSNPIGVTSLTMTFQYDVTLMNITEVQLGPDAPTGSQVQANLNTPGIVTLSFFALAPLTADQTDILEVIATVPEAATYGKAQVLDVTAVEVNAGALTAKANDAIHIAAYPGDANANRRYDAEDARLIARVGVGSDTGFVSATPTSATVTTPLFPLIDPLLLADVTGVDGISPLDASDVLRKVIGLSVPNLPNLPSQTPTDIALSATSVASGAASGTTVGTFSTTDPDAGDTFTYTLVTGTGSTDNSSFTISGNQLRTAAVFNAATKSSYAVRVRTTDASGKFFEESFTITVTATTNQAPTDLALSATTLTESQTTGAIVGTLSSTDPNSGNTFTYSLVTGTGSTDNGSFSINNNQLVLNTALNFETKSTYAIRLRTTDNGGATFEKTFTITVTNVNEAPTLIAASGTTVPASAAIGTTVGTLSTTDPDTADTHTYTLVTGTGDTDNAKFSIQGNQLRTAATFASQTTYSIRVRTTDAAGLTFEQVITGSITSGNAAPTDIALSSSSVAENTASGTTVGTLSTSDPNSGDTHTYALVTGTGSTDNAAFTINGTQLQLAASPDFETKSSYSIRVQTTDNNGLTFAEVFTITVTNVNEAPTASALSDTAVADGDPVGTVVGLLSTTDPDAADTFTYSLIAGTGSTDNSSFTISGSELRTAFVANQATKSSYAIRVRAQDAAGLNFERTFTITVGASNQAPTALSLSTTTLAENGAVGSVVGTLSSTDPNAGDTHTYSLVAGQGDTNNALFQIVGNELRLASSLNFESQPSNSVRIRTTDAGGLTFDAVFTIAVTNVNEAPTDAALSSSSVAENATVSSTIGQLSSVDQDASDTHTYTLVSGTGSTDNAAFTIDGNALKLATTLDFETKSSYSIRVRSTDAAGLNFEKAFAITVTNINEAPASPQLSTNTITDGTAGSTAVATISALDPDAGDTVTFSLVAGTGDTDNAAFTISGSNLIVSSAVDLATKSSYAIRVRATDAAGLNTEQALVMTVVETPVAPTAINLSATQIAENSAVGTAIGQLTSTDANSSDTHTYTLVAGTGDTGNASFMIVGNELRSVLLFNFETLPSLSIRVRSTDSGSLFFEQVFAITVTDVNEAPGVPQLSASTIADGTSGSTTVATISASDPDAGDAVTYSLVAGTGDTDNAEFTISGSDLIVTNAVDMATKSSYAIRIRATDSAGLTTEQALVMTVTDTPVAPTAINLSTNQVAEGATIGSTIGTLTSTDANSSDTHTYTLVAGTGDTDNASFTIVGNELRSATGFNFEGQPSFSILVRSTDSGSLFFEQVLLINVTDINEAPGVPQLSSSTITDGTSSSTTVATITASDPDAGDTVTFSLVSGTGDTDNAEFTISGSDLVVTNAVVLATKASYAIRIRATDTAGLTTEQSLVITVVETPVAPTAITLSADQIAENAAVGTAIGQFTSTDANSSDTHTYTLVAGSGDSGNGSFTIVGNELRSATGFNFEAQSSFSILVRSTDSGSLFFEQVFVITVTDVNEAPGIPQLSTSTVVDGTSGGTTVATISASDPDSGDSLIYSLVAGTGDTDNTAFTLSGSDLIVSSNVDLSTKSSYAVRIRATDTAGLSTEQSLVLTVTEIPAAPTALNLSASQIAEDVSTGSAVGQLTSTDANVSDTHTYTLVAGTGDEDNAAFTIVGNELRTVATFDFETKTSYNVRIRTTDTAGLTFEQAVVVTVTNVNEAPTVVTISSNTIANLQSSGTTVGALGTTDPDAGDTFAYTLVVGAGDTDNADFQIVGGNLVINENVDAAIQSLYSVRVKSVDAGGLEIEQILQITVV